MVPTRILSTEAGLICSDYQFPLFRKFSEIKVEMFEEVIDKTLDIVYDEIPFHQNLLLILFEEGEVSKELKESDIEKIPHFTSYELRELNVTEYKSQTYQIYGVFLK